MSVYIKALGGGISVVNSNVKNERLSFGKETVHKVDCSRDACLTGTTVEGNVCGGRIVAINAHVKGKLDAGGSVTAINSQIQTLNANGSVKLVHSNILNKIHARGSVTANRCEYLGSVEAGVEINLDDCPNVRSVSAGNMVTLRQTVVQGSVSAGANATIENVKIGGTLTCVSNGLIIEGAEIDTIELLCPEEPSVRSEGISTNIVSVRGNVFVSERGSVSINTGAIVMGSRQTRHSSDVFMNGTSLSQFQAQTKAKSSENKTPFSEPEPRPRQILELRGSKVRNVIFKGGNGEVVLDGEESTLSGKITGGKIRSRT